MFFGGRGEPIPNWKWFGTGERGDFSCSCSGGYHVYVIMYIFTSTKSRDEDKGGKLWLSRTFNWWYYNTFLFVAQSFYVWICLILRRFKKRCISIGQTKNKRTDVEWFISKCLRNATEGTKDHEWYVIIANGMTRMQDGNILSHWNISITMC